MKYKKHIPEGTQDILFDKCLLKNSLENNLSQLFETYGYAQIETPIFEFYDVFTQGKDSIPTEAMYKFYDSKGRILVLRPDMTVPVARVAGTKLLDAVGKGPLRVRYSGRVFRFNDSGFGGQKDIAQSGIELLGVKSPEADAEVIALAVNALMKAGLDDFKIDIGQVEFFKGLMEEGGFTEEETETIRELIDRKDMSGVEQILKEHDIDEKLKNLIMNLPSYFGDVDMVRQLEKSGLNERSKKALMYLDKVIELIKAYGVDPYISIDLGMVQKLNYYTGIIFKGFTGGVGFPVLSGGRYDNLVEKFGKSCTAVGFSVNLGMVMTALEKQNNEEGKFQTDITVGYAKGLEAEAFRLASQLRASGNIVETDLQGKTFVELKALAATRATGATGAPAQIAYLTSGSTVEIFDMKTGRTQAKTIQNLIFDADTNSVEVASIH